MAASLLGNVLGLGGEDLARANRYQVSQVIGEGGMGKVLAGVDTQLHRDVAIKVMTTVVDEEDVQRFYREAHLLASLRHPGIVQVSDYSGPSAERQYLVMERLQGRTLAGLVADLGRLNDEGGVALTFSLLDALDHAHTAGVVHRDLKPDNVFIEPDGRVVIIDFGVAKGARASSDRETFVGGSTKVLGTPAYASPEVLRGNTLPSPASDLYSLGATVYFALAGEPPFAIENLLDLVNAVLNKEHVSLHERGAASPELSRVIDAMLQKEPAQRPASARAARRAIDPLLAQIGEVSPAKVLARAIATTTLDRRRHHVIRPAALANAPAPSGPPRYLGQSGLVSSLAELKRRGAMTPPLFVQVARGLLSALAAAHAKGVVHGRLEADSVMVEPDGRVFLLAPNTPPTSKTAASDLRAAAALLMTIGQAPSPGVRAAIEALMMEKTDAAGALKLI